nr:AfaD family invasin [Escherichia coli]
MRRDLTGVLRDGERISVGRLICRDVHTGFYVSLEIAGQGEHAGHYVITRKGDSRRELRIRLGGEGWVTATEGKKGVVKAGSNELAVFDVVVDGNQHVAPGEYVFSVRGECVNGEP